jgi:hypothetical protein
MAKQTTLPIKTWQFYHACKHHLGVATIQKLFKVSPRQIDRWACDPDFAESSQRNPMDRYETLLKKLMELGAVDVARATVDRQAAIVGCSLQCEGDVVPDKETLEAECLDDLPALAVLHRAMLNKEPIQVVNDLARKAIKDIKEDLVLYQENNNQ